MQQAETEQKKGKIRAAFRSTGEFFRWQWDSAKEHPAKATFRATGVAVAMLAVIFAVVLCRTINDTYRKPDRNPFPKISKNIQQPSFADLQRRYNVDSAYFPYLLAVRGYIVDKDSVNALYSRMGIGQDYGDLAQYYADRPATLGMVLRNLRFYRRIIGSDEDIAAEISRLAAEARNPYDPKTMKMDICKIAILEGALYCMPQKIRTELGEKLAP